MPSWVYSKPPPIRDKLHKTHNLETYETVVARVSKNRLKIEIDLVLVSVEIALKMFFWKALNLSETPTLKNVITSCVTNNI